MKRILITGFAACWLTALATASPQIPEKSDPAGPSDLTESPVKAPISGRVRFPGSIMPEEPVYVRLETNTGRLLESVAAGTGGFFVFRRVVCGFYVLAVDVAGFAPLRMSIEHSFIPADGLQLTMRERGESSSSSKDSIPSGALREYQRALKLLEKKKSEPAVAALEKAITLHPRFDEAYSELALLHLERRDLTAARAVLEKAAQTDTQNARTLALLGRTARLQKDFSRAAEVLSRAVALHESSWVARWELAEALSALGRFEEAAPHASRAHELNAGVPALHQLHYNLLIRRSLYPAALAELDEFLRMFPGHSLANRARQQRAALAARVAAETPVALPAASAVRNP